MFSLVNLALFAAVASALPAGDLFSRANECSAGPASTTFASRVCNTSCGRDRAGGDLRAKYTGTFAACVMECDQDINCATAQFREETGYCYLKNTVNALVPGNGTDTVDCCPTPNTDATSGRVCKTTCGQDRPGGDYKAVYTGSVDGCIGACSSDSKCATAQYSLSNGYCYLKTTLHDFSAQLNVDSIDCCPGPKTIGSKTCTTTCGIDRPGGDIGAVYAGSVDACISACASSAECKTANYSLENGYCYLKNASNPSTPSQNIDTIDCVTNYLIG